MACMCILQSVSTKKTADGGVTADFFTSPLAKKFLTLQTQLTFRGKVLLVYGKDLMVLFCDMSRGGLR